MPKLMCPMERRHRKESTGAVGLQGAQMQIRQRVTGPHSGIGPVGGFGFEGSPVDLLHESLWISGMLPGEHH